MRNSTTGAVRQTFSEQGILFPVRVLSGEEAAAYLARCQELERALGGKPRTIEVRQMHLHFRWAYELATHPAILETVESLLGPNIALWATELFSKHPQDATVMIGWHRDEGYMGFPPDEVLTAWVALSDSSVQNGCMQAVPGPERLEEKDLLSPAKSSHQIPETAIDPARVVNVELQAGEMSVHDCRILHGSRPNLSDGERVGFAIRFVKGDAHPRNGRPSVVPVRGICRSDRFEILTPPEKSGGDVAEFKKSALEHFDAILTNLQQSSG